MYVLLLVMRTIHILSGVFWVGTMLFLVRLLFPAIRDGGPRAGSIMVNLAHAKAMTAIPIAGSLAILSGLYLYWHDSGGFNMSFMRTGMGMTYATGGLTAIIAMMIGGGVVRRRMVSWIALLQEPSVDEAALRTAQEGVAAVAGIVVILLTITGVAMAIGRYM